MVARIASGFAPVGKRPVRRMEETRFHPCVRAKSATPSSNGSRYGRVAKMTVGMCEGRMFAMLRSVFEARKCPGCCTGGITVSCKRQRGVGKVPEGRSDNSAAVLLLGCNPRKTSPAGTAELPPLLLPSLRDSAVCRPDPALKRWASAPESARHPRDESSLLVSHWRPEAEGNCVVERRGGEQPEANHQSVNNKKC